MSKQAPLRAPFPWFGGKSRIAQQVFQRLGPCEHYIEPFAGSLALLLANPHIPKLETVNDADAFLANFWRAVKYAPDEVARWADDQVSELDLHARHKWLCEDKPFQERMREDPHYYDAKMAGWWVWGQSCWIGRGWGSQANWHQRPHIAHTGHGVHSLGFEISCYATLQARLRRTRILCGDWARAVGASGLGASGRATIMLDPPYAPEDCAELYNVGRHVWRDVAAWCTDNTDSPHRIVLFGYEGTWDVPDGWGALRWKASGGYGNHRQGRAGKNASRECVWFSPACESRQYELAI